MAGTQASPTALQGTPHHSQHLITQSGHQWLTSQCFSLYSTLHPSADSTKGHDPDLPPSPLTLPLSPAKIPLSVEEAGANFPRESRKDRLTVVGLTTSSLPATRLVLIFWHTCLYTLSRSRTQSAMALCGCKHSNMAAFNSTASHQIESIISVSQQPSLSQNITIPTLLYSIVYASP